MCLHVVRRYFEAFGVHGPEIVLLLGVSQHGDG